MPAVRLAQASVLVDAVLDRAREIGLAPLTAAVLDPGGHLVVVKRQDGSGILRAEIAIAKAWGVLGMGLPARDLVDRARQIPHFFAALTVLSGGRMMPVPGGVPLRDESGAVVGAVGVSGDTSANDEECAVHGARAAGLFPWLDRDPDGIGD